MKDLNYNCPAVLVFGEEMARHSYSSQMYSPRSRSNKLSKKQGRRVIPNKNIKQKQTNTALRIFS